MPSRLKALVSLASRANFLNITAEHFQPLIGRFPHIDFEFLDSFDDLERRVAEADIVVTWEFTPGLYRKAPRLRALFTPAAGREWAPPDPSGAVPSYYGAFHGKVMAESLLAMVLYFSNRLHIMRQRQLSRVWDRNAAWPMRLLRNQRVLLVGYGAIGRHCARALAPLGCAMAGVRRAGGADVDRETGVRCVAFDNLADELARADHVVLILPGGPSTHHVVTREHLRVCKAGAFLYNIGRGSVVAEEDVIWALETGAIAGAGLDVFEQEPLPASSKLWDMPGVLVLPHSCAGYAEYAAFFVEELGERLAAMPGLC